MKAQWMKSAKAAAEIAIERNAAGDSVLANQAMRAFQEAACTFGPKGELLVRIPGGSTQPWEDAKWHAAKAWASA
jgi:hypothetical protein